MLPADALSPQSALPSPVSAGANGKVQGTTRAKLPEMAKELEATFLSMLLKEMRQTLEPEGLFPGDTGDVQGGLFDLFLGRHLADTGGVGMAAALVRQMAPSEGAAKQIAFPDDAKPGHPPTGPSPGRTPLG